MNRNLIFPGAVYGTRTDLLGQVEEVVATMHAVLAEQGLGIGAMLQHTLFVRAGVVSPLEVLDRFHPATYALAPELKTLKSAGTIIRVPEFSDARTAIALEVVAGVPLSREAGQDGYTRVPFTYGPPELSETVGDDKLVFTAGTEGLDFHSGKLASDLDGQVAKVVDKLLHAATASGLTLSQMIHHNLYVTVGNDPGEVSDKFHKELKRREPGVAACPVAGSLMVVDGMAVDAFRLEIDAVFTKQNPGRPRRVPLRGLDLAESVASGGLVFVNATPGPDFAQDTNAADGLDSQLELAVENLADALAKQGSSLDRLIRYRLVVKKGAGDVSRARARFLELAIGRAPKLKGCPPAETLLVVEGLLDRRLVEVFAIAESRHE